MKILLVDDDKIVTETMLNSSLWADCGITEVRTAWSAMQAKQLLCEERIDILLCDIEMPMENGIELIEWIKAELGYSVVTILLTCHSEFQYTQRAVQLGCSNYLLKPADEADLKKAILTAEEQVVENQKQEKEHQRREQKIHNMDAFWEALFAHGIERREKLQRICEEYEIDKIQKSRPVYITVKHHSFKIRDVSGSLMSFILENVIREVFQDQKIALVNNYSERLWLFFPETAEQESSDEEDEAQKIAGIKDSLEEIEDWLMRTYECALACYVGNVCALEGWKTECDLLRDADSHYAVSPYVYLPVDIRKKKQRPFEYLDKVPNHFQSLFMSGKYDALLQKMEEFFSALTPEQCDVAALGAFVRCMDQNFEKHLEGKETEKFRRQQIKLFRENPTYVNSVPGVLEYYRRLFEILLETEQEDQTEGIIEKVKLFISMNMQQEIRREDVAAHVGMNPDYLNRIFKKNTGTSLKEYIAAEKIRMACELLEQTDLLVGEIGEMVGYVNFSSFSTFFKSQTGKTPAAWRKEHETC